MLGRSVYFKGPESLVVKQ
uniref:Uncharacterized protein n=1 Tax=Anguilla anguilla TaxID=7936 RepID=A0A0E9XPB1_ANGAN